MKKDYLKDVLRKSYWDREPLWAYNVASFDAAYFISEVLRKHKRPIVIQTSQRVAEYFGPETWVYFTVILKRQSQESIFLSLDHCHDIRFVKRCVDAGYDLVMFDGSSFPLKRNIHLTKKVADYAHEQKCLAEGELGSLLPLGHSHRGKSCLTDPNEAETFVRETGVDLFAPTFGNIHGVYSSQKKRLDFKLLAKIASKVTVPLVLHGATGLKPSEIIKCINLGVTKINISTKLKQIFSSTFKDWKSTDQSSDPFLFQKQFRVKMDAALIPQMALIDQKIQKTGKKVL